MSCFVDLLKAYFTHSEENEVCESTVLLTTHSSYATSSQGVSLSHAYAHTQGRRNPGGGGARGGVG